MDWVSQERKINSVFNPFDLIPDIGIGNIILEYHVKEDILYRYYRMPRAKGKSWKKLGIHDFSTKNKGEIFVHPEDLERFEKNFCQGQCKSMAVRIRKIQEYGWYCAYFRGFCREGELRKVRCILKEADNLENSANESALSELLNKEPVVKQYLNIRDEILYRFSREIQNAMNAIIGKTDILLMNEISSETADQLNRIRNISSSLNEMVSNILEQRYEIVPSNYQMTSVMMEIYNIVRTQVKERSIKLFFDIDESVPDYLIGDRVKICQILQKFIHYSIKFTSHGSITIKVGGHRQTDDEYCLHLSIIDTGIDMEKRVTWTQDFFDWNMSGESQYRSFGLELLVSRKQVQLMGGDVVIESKNNEGTQVHITLIQKVGKENLVLQKVKKPLHILILENDVLVLQHIVRLMNQLKIKFTTCKTYESVKFQVDYTHVLLRSEILFRNRRELERRFGRKRIIVLNDQSDNQILFKKYQQVLIPFMCIQLPPLLNDCHTLSNDPKFMFHTGSVLVVEDNTGQMETIRSHLERYPLSVDLAETKRKAMEFLQEKIYDLVLMDQDMEGLSGIETLSRIRSFGRGYQDMPVIALTADNNMEKLEELLHMGFQDFLVKPVEVSKVSRIVQKYVRIKDLYLGAFNIEERPPLNYPCMSLLGKLKEANQSMEYDFAEEIVLDMLGFTYPQKIKEHLYDMFVCLEEFDYEEFDRLSDELLDGCE